MRSKKTPRAGTAATAAALLMLAGCSGGAGSADAEDTAEAVAPLEERVTFEEVTLPEELTSTSRGAGSWSTVAQAGDLPRLAVTRVFHGKANPADIGIWQATGDDALSEQGEVEIAGDVRGTSVASDGELTAIAGRTVIDGKSHGYLLTSTDRTTWEQVDLPEDVAAGNANEIAVAEGRIYLLGSGATGRAPRLAVYDTADATSSVTDLPAPGEGEMVSLSGVAAQGQHVVVITEVGPTGEDVEPVAHVSTDGGATFTGEGMGGADFDINGVTVAGGDLVAVGSVRSGAYKKPSAWSSSDGVRWSTDDISSSLWEWDPMEWAGASSDVAFFAPVNDPGATSLTATIVHEAHAVVGIATRSEDGTWTPELYATPQGANPTAVAVKTESTVRAVSTSNYGSAHEQAWELESYDDSVTPLVDYATEAHALETVDLGDGVGLNTRLQRFAVDEDAGTYSQWTETEAFSYTPGSGLVKDEWGPEDAVAGAAASDPDTGRALLAGGGRVDGAFPIDFWLRDEAGEWSKTARIAETDFQQASTVVRTAEGWLVGGYQAQTAYSDQARLARVWVSSDGVTWEAQEVSQPFPDGRASRIHSFCDTSTGMLAVGQALDERGESRAVSWSEVDGVWQETFIDDANGTWVDSCAAMEDGVVVVGGDGLGSTSWKSTDGQTFEKLETLEDGQRRLDMVEVPGGFAAGGALLSEEYYGPVVWLSPDAENWRWLPLPTTSGAIDSSSVTLAGDDLLVLHDASLGVWRVPDIASVFAE